MFHIGLDESGHGSIAGPMTVGLVRVDPTLDHQQLWALGIKDSKLTSEETRANLCDLLLDYATLYSITIPVSDINLLKHNQALDKHVLEFIRSQPKDIEMYIDGLRTIDQLSCKATYIVNGDQSNALIAAASIVGKRAHDLAMQDLHDLYPDWKFDEHRGYPIPEHVELIVQRQPIPGVHKLSPTFTAVTNFCKKNNIRVPKWASSKDKLKKLLCN